MAKSVNRVVIVGNLTRDPELRHTTGGTSVCELGVAVNDREKINGEWTDRPNYFDVTVWSGQGEACAKYLSKGDRVTVDGRLRYESWETDGQKRSKVRIVAESVVFPTRGSRSEQSGSSEPDWARDPEPAAASSWSADADESWG